MYNAADFILIRQIELFKDIPDDELKKILEITFIKDYPLGAVLFNEGMDGDVMYVIVNGEVQLSKKKEKESVLIASLKGGSFFGEMSLIENEKRSATAKISVPTKMLVITRRTFQQLLEVNPHITSKLLMMILRVMSRRLRLAINN
jgi:CRP-like cAMP-binding protein